MPTIHVKESTKDKLDDEKIHPREPYDEVINRLLERIGSPEKD